jgi:hypothetical protein
MSGIYAAAQLTIVAAAGQDPSHGLPGVHRDFKLPNICYKTIRANQLVVLPFSGCTNITNSKWHSRAWTFQEGFSSRRRLCFTDSEVLYICNSGTRGDILHPGTLSRRSLDDCLPTHGSLLRDHESVIARAMRYMQAYSRRRLTYDSDALNAIKSSLDASAHGDNSFYHCWGVPFKYNPNIDRLHIGLNWHYEATCRRRHDFPSWSMLGWEGPIRWHDHQYELSPELTRVSNSPTDHQTVALQSYFTVDGMRDAARYIWLECYTLTVRTVAVDPSALESMNAPMCHWDTGTLYVGASLFKDMDVLLRTQWDRIPSDGKPLIGIQSIIRSHGLNGDGMLVLEMNGDSYLRVGMCTWNISQPSSDILFRDYRLGKTFKNIFATRTGQGKNDDMSHLNTKLGHMLGQISTLQRICVG